MPIAIDQLVAGALIGFLFGCTLGAWIVDVLALEMIIKRHLIARRGEPTMTHREALAFISRDQTTLGAFLCTMMGLLVGLIHAMLFP